jgi:hypothetical protein
VLDRASLDRLFSKAAERLKREDDALRQTLDRIDEIGRPFRADVDVKRTANRDRREPPRH